MKKVIIIGGNQGGLAMAYRLGKLGFDVTVYEKKAREKVAYDWYDDIDPAVFGELNLPLPPKDCYTQKKHWTFVNPKENVKITVDGGGQENDISIERRPLNDYFYDLAKDKAKIIYETEVQKLITEGGKIVGVTVNDKNEKADLVVDCSGVYSVFRRSLPEACGIQPLPEEDEVFVAFRGFFKRNDGVEVPEQTNKAYLRHAYNKGISWCVVDKYGTVDVLIGRVGSLTDDEREEEFKVLQGDNPILSDELVKCGYTCTIPVRYPISMMVADGYVLCGDSAFMTIPMMGSGIVCSLTCAKFLAEVLEKNEDCTKENLWNYQVKFYEKFGSYAGVDVLKRWLLSVDPKDIDFLFESGVIDADILGSGTTGGSTKMPFGQLLKKGWQGRKRIGLLLKLAKVMGKSDKAVKVASAIPQSYDETKVFNWQFEYDGLYINEAKK